MTIIEPWMITIIVNVMIIGVTYAAMKQLGVIDYIHRIIKELKEKRKGEPK
jgi:membrane protein insertase Oxa1/YidC/SpoIIIJ